MKIHEIIGAKELRSYLPRLTTDGISDELSSHHEFERIGSGVYGTALSHPRLPYVVKVFRSADRGYQAFVHLAMVHPSNPHFPRFRGRLIKLGGSSMGIRMERLLPMSMSRFEEMEMLCNQLAARHEPDRAPGSVADELLTRWPKLEEAFKLLHMARPAGTVFDLHPGNIMERDDGTPVITDPFS